MRHQSPRERRLTATRRAPKRHAMDRLIERHMPEINDDGAEGVIDVMTTVCCLLAKAGRASTAKLVKIEKPDSWIVDLDLFEDRGAIRVTYDPLANRIRTVLPR